MKTRNIIMIVVVSLIFLVAGGLSIYAAVMHETTLGSEEHFSHNENGFVDSSLRWADTPIPVSCREIREGGCSELRDAVATWNRQIGHDLFEMRDDAVIRVTVGVAYDAQEWDSPGGQFRLHRQGSTFTSCDIETSNTGQTAVLSRVLMHELGHCMGLEHDGWSGSVMFPVQSPNAYPHVSDHDQTLIRNEYFR